jgi:cell division protein FtsZ
MTLNLNVPTLQPNLTPQITVIGVGGAGGNAVNNMIQSNLEGVDFLIANTDAQAIQQSLCEHNIQLGRGVTQGLGSGSKPDVGRAAAEEALDDILTALDGANMVFITAGMGGGTGTGGAPVIARAAREAGVLTVGVVTKPFHFEGVHRMRIAEAGITELTQYVDTLIVIPNQNLFRIANEKTTFADAFKMADDVLHAGVRGVTDLMVMPGLINLDFADIRSVMTEMGKAMMGTGEAEGASRALEAAEAAISNPLLDDVSMRGARGVLINITGGPDMTLFEVDETANRIRDEVDPEANIIFGSTYDQNLEGRIRVSVVATGIDAEEAVQPRPAGLSLVSAMAARDASPPTVAAESLTATTAVPGQAVPTPMSAQPAAPAAMPIAKAPAMPAQAKARNSLYAYSQAAAAGGAADPAPVAKTSTAVAESMAAEVMAVGTSQVAVAPEIYEEPVAYTAEPAPQIETYVEVMAAPVADSFIAPLPAEPEPAPEPEIRAPARAPARVQAEPFAAAALENGSRAPRDAEPVAVKAPEPRKAPGFFAKMTGGASRAIQAAAKVGEQHGPRAASRQGPAQTAAAPRATPPLPAEPRLGARSMPAARAAEPPAAEPRLSGFESASPDPAGQVDEDLLDIPAFLRRQAN